MFSMAWLRRSSSNNVSSNTTQSNQFGLPNLSPGRPSIPRKDPLEDINGRRTERLQGLTNDQIGDVVDCPQMYYGYPYFTRWIASCEDGLVLRRFDQLHTRVLLRMQDKIVEVEDKLNDIDRQHMNPLSTQRYHNGSFRTDRSCRGVPDKVKLFERDELLEKLEDQLRKYDEMILNHRRLRSDPDPPDQSIRNIRNYLENRGYSNELGEADLGPILDAECAFIHKKGDLSPLVPKAKQPLRRWLDGKGWFMLPPIGYFFQESPESSNRYEDEYSSTTYQSDAKIDKFLTVVTLVAGGLLLVLPLQLLNSVKNDSTKINWICGLISLFLMVMATIMVSKPWETLAATAAYAAVLMVFMQ